MIKDNIYQDEAVEAGVRSIISRYNIREDYCEACDSEANFVKIVDCDDYWRCMGCLTISKRKFALVPETTLKRLYKNANEKNSNEELTPDFYDVRRAKIQILAKEQAEKELAEKEKFSE
jgi:hypothetical protein